MSGRQHASPVSVPQSNTNESDDTKCWRGCGTTATCFFSGLETVWLYLVKLKMSMSHEPAIFCSCVYAREKCVPNGVKCPPTTEQVGQGLLCSNENECITVTSEKTGLRKRSLERQRKQDIICIV